MSKKIITRRDFLKAGAGIALGGILIKEDKTKVEKGSERVVLIRDKNVFTTKDNFNPRIVQKMIDEALMILTGENDPLKAWKTIIRPNDIVGIKSNVWAYLPTPEEVEEAIVKRVKEVGVSVDNISVDDR